VKSQYQYVYWKVQKPELLELGAIFRTCWITGIFGLWTPYKRQYWSCLRYIKNWIVISYKGLKFPQNAVVLLLLESDAACTSLTGHCAWKSAVLVLDDAVNPRVIDKNVEVTDHLKAALRSGMWSLNVIVAYARSMDCGQSEAVTLLYLVPWLSTPTYRVKTQDSKHYESQHWPEFHLLSR